MSRPICKGCGQLLRSTGLYPRLPIPGRALLALNTSSVSKSSPTAFQSRHATTAPAGQSPRAAANQRRLQENVQKMGEVHVALQATESLFKECARQADYIVPQAFDGKAKAPRNENGEEVGEGTGWWYENLGLQPTFSSWAHITMMHMYIIVVRLRYFSPDISQLWLQHLTDHFFYEAEHRMTLYHGISSRMLRNRHLKELHDSWRGSLGAYDEGLIKGDAVLAGAIWRNLFGANDDVDWRRIAMVVSFMRRGLRALDRASDETIVGALVKFGNPMSEMEAVLRKVPEAADDLGGQPVRPG